jgi:serine/threonine-protein kinase
VSAPKLCPTCSTEYPITERFCPKDGAVLRAQDSAAGDLLGSIIAERYHVTGKLGEGGMGQVYLAEHVKMGRRSAVKVMHPAMVHDANTIARFNREAANASRIDHPNVAAIYDFGETPEGLVYLAMQYVDGETLTQLVRDGGAQPVARAVEIVRQAAEGLHAAHGLGIVHRDLKPDNIMITRDRDGLDCVKVVDFGIAKGSGNGTGGQKVTKTGIVVGTPEYMSPEQLSGEEVDPRSDLYSLALVAFNLLTGELPFPSESTQTSMIMRLTEPPRSLAEIRPDIAWPAELETVMRRALARQARDRYATTREFARALQGAAESALAAPAASTASAASERTVMMAPPRRRELAIAGGALGALAAIVVAVLLLRGGRSTGSESAAFAQGVTAYRGGQRAAAAERFSAAATEAPADPMPHVYLARIAREGSDLTTANVEAVTAVRLGPENGAALRELATISFVQQNYTGARTFYTRAIKADPGDRLSQGFLGCTLIRLGRGDEGMRWIERAGSGSWSGCAPAAQSSGAPALP